MYSGCLVTRVLVQIPYREFLSLAIRLVVQHVELAPEPIAVKFQMYRLMQIQSGGI